jgi:hypothetical protein
VPRPIWERPLRGGQPVAAHLSGSSADPSVNRTSIDFERTFACGAIKLMEILFPLPGRTAIKRRRISRRLAVVCGALRCSLIGRTAVFSLLPASVCFLPTEIIETSLGTSYV